MVLNALLNPRANNPSITEIKSPYHSYSYFYKYMQESAWYMRRPKGHISARPPCVSALLKSGHAELMILSEPPKKERVIRDRVRTTRFCRLRLNWQRTHVSATATVTETTMDHQQKFFELRAAIKAESFPKALSIATECMLERAHASSPFI